MLSSVTINCQVTKIVMNQGPQLSEGLGAERKAKKIQVGIVGFGCNLGGMFTFMGRT